MKTTLDIAQIVIAVALVTAILFQIKGGGPAGFSGSPIPFTGPNAALTAGFTSVPSF